MTRILIGTGNPLAGDDAAGRIVARKVRSRLPADVRVVEAAGDGAQLLDFWSEGDDVILVDAAVSGGLPGTIHRLDAVAGPVPARVHLRSSHAFGVAPGIELARSLSRLPGRLTLYAIEAGSFDTGAEPSPGVARAIDEVADAVVSAWARAPASAEANGGGRLTAVSIVVGELSAVELDVARVTFEERDAS